MSEHALEPTEPGQPRDDEHPSSDESGERPELRAIPVAGRQRASDLPPPPRTAPANAVVPTGEATPVPTTMLDSHQDTVARSSRLREDLLANPRRTIRRLYEEEHPEWRLDRNATFALPPAVWDTITRHSAEIGVPAKRLMTALAVSYLAECGVAIEENARH